MTLLEMLGGAAGALAAAGATYQAVTAKVNSIVGKRETPDDGTLRDLIMRIDGKIDAHHEQTSERFDGISKRLELVEDRVFTPPQRLAIRVAKASE